MRALNVSFYHPDITPGGAQQVAYNLHRGLLAERWNSFFLGFHNNLSARLTSSATPITKMAGRSNEYLVNVTSFDFENYVSGNAWTVDAVLDLAVNLKPDVIFVHHFLLVGIDTIILLRRLLPHAKFIFVAHEFLTICKRDGHLIRPTGEVCTSGTSFDCTGCFPNSSPKDFSVRKFSFNAMYEAFDLVITPSEFAATALMKFSGVKVRPKVIGNGSLFAARHPEATRKRRSRGHTIAFFGQVLRDKGISFLLENIEKMLAADESITLHIWGSGLELNPAAFIDEFMHRMNALNDAFGRQCIQLMGKYSNDSVSELMKRYETVIFPSLWPETFSLVFTEAVSAGCKIVVPNIGVFPERASVYKGNVFFYSLGDGQGMAEALYLALKSVYQPISAVDLRKFSVSGMTGAYIQAVNSPAAAKSGRPSVRAASSGTKQGARRARNAESPPSSGADQAAEFGSAAGLSLSNATAKGLPKPRRLAVST